MFRVLKSINIDFLSAAYDPLADTCDQFYKFGIIPAREQCITVVKTDGTSKLECCWKNLFSTQVFF